MYSVRSVEIKPAEAARAPGGPAPAAHQPKVVAERIHVDGGEGVVIFRSTTTTRCTRYLLKEVFE